MAGRAYGNGSRLNADRRIEHTTWTDFTARIKRSASTNKAQPAGRLDQRHDGRGERGLDLGKPMIRELTRQQGCGNSEYGHKGLRSTDGVERLRHT